LFSIQKPPHPTPYAGRTKAGTEKMQNAKCKKTLTTSIACAKVKLQMNMRGADRKIG